MKRILLGLLAALFLTCAHAQVPMTGAGKGTPGAATPLTVNASNSNCQTSASSTITVTTTVPNTIIILFARNNSSGILSVADTSALTWTKRSETADFKLDEWWAKSSGTLSGDTITITYNGSGFNFQMLMAVAGANFSSPFDPNGALPSPQGSAVNHVTTTNANTIVYGGYNVNTGSPTAGTGFTGITTGGCFSILEYKIVSSTQSALAISLGTGAGLELDSIADAVSQ